MFIKKIKKKNGKTQKIYEYLHLVESVRTSDGPRHRLVLNLGNLDIDPSQFKSLAKRIEDILTGQKSFFEVDKKVEKHAKEATEKIFKKRAKELSDEIQPEYEQVDVNSLESSVHRSLGAEYLCHSIWQGLQMNDFFLKKGISKHVLPILEALVVGRLVDPGSERYTKEWAEKRSAIYELIGTPLRGSLNSYYQWWR